MSAPLSTAQVSPSRIHASVLDPPWKMRTGMIETFQQTPVTPMPLSPTAPMRPAQAVPWAFPTAFPGIPPGGEAVVASCPVTTAAARSGCSTSTPLSRTATVTAELPVVTSQALLVWASA